MTRAQRAARAGPNRVVVRQLHLLAGRGTPAVLHVVRLRLRARLQQPHVRRVRLQRLAIVGEHQIVQPRAQQADRAAQAMRRDRDPRDFLGHRLSRRDRRGLGGSGRGLRRRALGIGELRRRRLGWLRQVRRDQQLEAEQNGDRDRNRQEQPFLVHHAAVRQSQAGTGS